MNDKSVLFSIKPNWVMDILDGTKEYEYRKTPPDIETPYRGILYATSPESAIMGECIINTHIEKDKNTLINETVDKTPHSRQEVESYFEGCKNPTAIHIKEAFRYPEELIINIGTLRECGIEPPQNFRYLTPRRDGELLDLLPASQTQPKLGDF
jgi:predicted transcriptional regulator